MLIKLVAGPRLSALKVLVGMTDTRYYKGPSRLVDVLCYSPLIYYLIHFSHSAIRLGIHQKSLLLGTRYHT